MTAIPDISGSAKAAVRDKQRVSCASWRRMRRNTLVGFANIRLNDIRLTIKDIAIHERDGRCWAQLPAKPQLRDGIGVKDETGKLQYFPVLEFDSRAVADAFAAAVIAAVRELDPEAFADVPVTRPVPQ
jgi:hypothetical protein